MGQFLYHIPGQPPKDDLNPWGLGHLAASAKMLCRSGNSLAGPEGNSGHLFCVNDSISVAYSPKDQEWKRAPGGKFWIGYWRDNKPGPHDLRLKDAIPGQSLLMLDGKKWEVLRARKYSDNGYVADLPRLITLNDDSKWVEGPIVRQYRKFYDDSVIAAPLLFGRGTEDEIAQADAIAFDVVVQSLTLIYRVSAVEIDFLELMDTRKAGEVLREVLDFQGWKTLAKNLMSRLESNEPNGSDGAERLTQAETPDTSQPLAS